MVCCVLAKSFLLSLTVCIVSAFLFGAMSYFAFDKHPLLWKQLRVGQLFVAVLPAAFEKLFLDCIVEVWQKNTRCFRPNWDFVFFLCKWGGEMLPMSHPNLFGIELAMRSLPNSLFVSQTSHTPCIVAIYLKADSRGQFIYPVHFLC